MAGIEKVCELSGEYPSWKMYGYKRNLIQIMPKYRKLFKGAEHELHIWKPEKKVCMGPNQLMYEDAPIIHPNAQNSHKWSDIEWNQAEKDGYSIDVFIKGECYQCVFSSLTDMRKRLKEYDGSYLCDYYTWELRVSDPALQGDVDGVYYNYGFNISTTKRKIKRMLGCRKLNIVKHDMTYSEWCAQNKA